MQSLIDLFVARQLGFVSDWDAVIWACQAAASDPANSGDPDLMALAGLTREEESSAPSHLQVLVAREHPGFRMDSEAAEAVVLRLFRQFCERFVTGDATAAELCRAVEGVQKYFGYPQWMMNFDDVCFGVHGNLKAEEAVHLAAEAHRFLRGSLPERT